MMMLEHEGKRLLASAGVAIAPGTVVSATEPLDKALSTITTFPVAVKAQVRSGGRGKQGGVRKVESAAELQTAAKALFNLSFGGENPEALLIEPWLAIERESYLSVAVD